MHFAAANVEAQFVIAPRPEVAASVIAATRDLLPKYGRSREELKFFQGLSFVIGSTEEEAAHKSRELDEAIDAEAMIAHLGGAMDVGLDDYSLDDPISDIQTDGARSLLDWVQVSVVGRPATVRDVSLLANQAGRVTGTPKHIADQLATWQEAGVRRHQCHQRHNSWELHRVHRGGDARSPEARPRERGVHARHPAPKIIRSPHGASNAPRGCIPQRFWVKLFRKTTRNSKREEYR